MHSIDVARAAARFFARWGSLFSFGLGAALLLSNKAAAQEDVVVFANGDRLTGEIRRLDRGRLSFKTDATGTIGVAPSIGLKPASSSFSRKYSVLRRSFCINSG